MASRHTLTPRWAPTWQGPFEKYSLAFTKRNAWRVAAHMSSEDALQQCGLVFARCLRLYNRRVGKPGWGRVDNPAWFMALFKRALDNEFNTLSRKIGRSYRAQGEFVAETMRRDAEHEHNPGPMLAGLSSELRDVLRVVAVAPSELLAMLLREGDDKTWSRRLCRLCGIYPSETIVAELRDLAKPEGK